jgi:hypothetical protein
MKLKKKSPTVNIFFYNALKELFKKHLDINSLQINISDSLKYIICEKAAKNGDLDILKWAREKGCRWNEWTCFHAATGGHLEILKWARENGCPWDKWTCAAAYEDHLDIFKWAVENGCPWNIKTINNFILPRLFKEHSFYFSHFILSLFQKIQEDEDFTQKQIIQLQNLIQEINENMNCLRFVLCEDLCTTVKNYL